MGKYRMRGIIFKLVIMMTICFSIIYIRANSEVEVNILSKNEYFTPEMDIKLNVKFNNPRRYNNNVYIAYHIYDENNKEIVWEGERIPMQLNKEFEQDIILNIDLNKYINIQDYKTAYIQFDIIDELNKYWFSTDNVATFDFPKVIYKENKLKEFVAIYTDAIIQRPIIFFTNIVIFCVVIYGAFKLKINR